MGELADVFLLLGWEEKSQGICNRTRSEYGFEAGFVLWLWHFARFCFGFSFVIFFSSWIFPFDFFLGWMLDKLARGGIGSVVCAIYAMCGYVWLMLSRAIDGTGRGDMYLDVKDESTRYFLGIWRRGREVFDVV
ncbi:hypothetical protein TWF225_000692 [Orbilia oligospora]|uniref:Uncharacterized protein n=1 Tax=Orbilia oligospora TaxID=2813651 RepID=A0A7C8K0I4_ORBOL|nr:hypothetical protein TWF751_002076 [Orbilia oligospora]KAF3166746.1 hypothetical protein TWF225_000692 [Orbilia oligospora]KAF3237215.1 hypothetical protein TWF128_000981 [Orbilia oligospora]KAF3242353.1 hypothetical protein TWF217_011779 [Orbilia oligospora]KAF3296007.1 hypothetical protein TWF132_000548 [Orbilia oligospora]